MSGSVVLVSGVVVAVEGQESGSVPVVCREPRRFAAGGVALALLPSSPARRSRQRCWDRPLARGHTVPCLGLGLAPGGVCAGEKRPRQVSTVTESQGSVSDAPRPSGRQKYFMAHERARSRGSLLLPPALQSPCCRAGVSRGGWCLRLSVSCSRFESQSRSGRVSWDQPGCGDGVSPRAVLPALQCAA